MMRAAASKNVRRVTGGEHLPRRITAPAVPYPTSSLQRKACACGGDCPRCRDTLPIQAKLTISEPGDAYEQEADRIADRVMRMPEPVVQGHALPITPLVQKTEGSGTGRNVPSNVNGLLSSPGKPLKPATRAFFEPRFGQDLGHVRLHMDERAVESARAMNALAYTLGNHIVFGAKDSGIDTAGARRLLAHELTHVFQQDSASLQTGKKTAFMDHGSLTLAAESESRGRYARPTLLVSAPGVLQRKGKDGECSWSDELFYCATFDKCLLSDRTIAGWAGPVLPSTEWWKLTVKIDIEAQTAADVSLRGNWGHTFLEFSESNGDVFTYGFYPAEAMSEVKTRVDGCVAHPDTVHDPCVDYREEFNLTEVQYRHALANVMDKCRQSLMFDAFSYNCTSFANEVVTDAGHSLPPIQGKATALEYDADNPNTLLEGLRERDQAMKQSGF